MTGPGERQDPGTEARGLKTYWARYRRAAGSANPLQIRPSQVTLQARPNSRLSRTFDHQALTDPPFYPIEPGRNCRERRRIAPAIIPDQPEKILRDQRAQCDHNHVQKCGLTDEEERRRSVKGPYE